MSKNVELDLHGLTWEQAQNKILFLIDELKNYKIDTVLFVTGKGTQALKTFTIKLLDDNFIDWEITNKNGAILAYIEDDNVYFGEENFNSKDQEKNIEEIFEKFKLNI